MKNPKKSKRPEKEKPWSCCDIKKPKFLKGLKKVSIAEVLSKLPE